jgi:hypothetical protein
MKRSISWALLVAGTALAISPIPILAGQTIDAAPNWWVWAWLRT